MYARRVESTLLRADSPQVAPPTIRETAAGWTVTVGVLFALGVWSTIVSALFWPGQVDPDTRSAVQDVSTGHFLDWHAPILEVVWRALYLAGVHGTGPVLFASVFTLIIGFYLVLRVRFGIVGSCVGTVLCSVFPPILTWEAHVGTDAWFAALLLAGFGSAARAARVTGRSRNVSLVAAVMLAFLGLAARHNAFPAVAILLVVVVGLWMPSTRQRRRTWAVGLGLALTVAMLIAQIGMLRVVHTQSMHAAQNTMIYDLTTLSQREGKVLLPRVADPGQNLAVIVHGTTVEGDEPLIYARHAPIRWPLEGSAYQALTRSWESAVLKDPTGYLLDRLRSGAFLLGITHSEFWLFQEPSTTSTPKFPSLNRPAISYLSAATLNDNNLNGSVIYDAWIYALVMLAASILLWRRTVADRVLAMLAVAVLLYTLVTIFAVPEMLYRYVYIDVVAGVVLLPVLWPRRSVHTPAHRIGADVTQVG